MASNPQIRTRFRLHAAAEQHNLLPTFSMSSRRTQQQRPLSPAHIHQHTVDRLWPPDGDGFTSNTTGRLPSTVLSTPSAAAVSRNFCKRRQTITVTHKLKFAEEQLSASRRSRRADAMGGRLTDVVSPDRGSDRARYGRDVAAMSWLGWALLSAMLPPPRRFWQKLGVQNMVNLATAIRRWWCWSLPGSVNSFHLAAIGADGDLGKHGCTWRCLESRAGLSSSCRYFHALEAGADTACRAHRQIERGSGDCVWRCSWARRMALAKGAAGLLIVAGAIIIALNQSLGESHHPHFNPVALRRYNGNLKHIYVSLEVTSP